MFNHEEFPPAPLQLLILKTSIYPDTAQYLVHIFISSVSFAHGIYSHDALYILTCLQCCPLTGCKVESITRHHKIICLNCIKPRSRTCCKSISGFHLNLVREAESHFIKLVVTHSAHLRTQPRVSTYYFIFNKLQVIWSIIRHYWNQSCD